MWRFCLSYLFIFPQIFPLHLKSNRHYTLFGDLYPPMASSINLSKLSKIAYSFVTIFNSIVKHSNIDIVIPFLTTFSSIVKHSNLAISMLFSYGRYVRIGQYRAKIRLHVLCSLILISIVRRRSLTRAKQPKG